MLRHRRDSIENSLCVTPTSSREAGDSIKPGAQAPAQVAEFRESPRSGRQRKSKGELNTTRESFDIGRFYFELASKRHAPRITGKSDHCA